MSQKSECLNVDVLVVVLSVIQATALSDCATDKKNEASNKK